MPQLCASWMLCTGLSAMSVLLCIALLQWNSKRRKPGYRLPPGRLGLPLLGETLELIAAYRSSNPEPFADRRRKRYGNVFKTHLLGKPTIFSTDPEMNKFVLQNEGKLFASNYPQTMVNLLGKHSLLLTHGDLHKKLYSLTWSFTNSAVLKDHLMADVEALVCVTLGSWADRTVFVQDEAKKITFDLSVRQLLTASPGQWTETLRQEYLQLIEGFFSLPIRLPGTTYSKALQARREVARKLSDLVKERRCDQITEYHDMLAALLKNNVTKGESLSDQQIIDLIISLLVAGYETTSLIMTLAVKFVTDNPEVLERLRVEHSDIKNKKPVGEKLQWNDYKCMTFTQYVINETLRMGNIITGVFRKALQDVRVNGYTIPKDWVVFTSFRAVHLDEAIHRDSKKFNPWRWQGSNASANFGINFTPFGGGPRFCPGYELARVQISIFLHHLVTQFTWEAVGEDTVIYFPTTRLVNRYPIAVKRTSHAL
eukprot:c27805_g1_i1 orf=633-2081(-)